jgi:hypothetical protein
MLFTISINHLFAIITKPRVLVHLGRLITNSTLTLFEVKNSLGAVSCRQFSQFSFILNNRDKVGYNDNEGKDNIMAKIRVLLAEDHAIMREGVREFIGRESDMEVVGEAGDGEEAVKLTAQLKPDVVVMDIRCPN